MSVLLRLPHGLIRRYMFFVERLLVAAGLSVLLYGLTNNLPVYPPNWDLVILATVFVVALWWPGAAYFLAVAAAAYPIYTLSLYIFVLFLAVALLGQRIFIHNLGATVLVLSVPWLARYNVAWAIPLLGGLWWGAAGGAWMGALSALWGQLMTGMAGRNPDWLTLIGTSPSITGVAQRFGQANSLDTLKLILEPIAPNTTLLLYHLLQVIAWAAAGGLVGLLADRAWIQQRRPWGAMVAGIMGAVALLGAHFGLALWLDQYTLTTLLSLAPVLLATTVVVAVLVIGLEGLRDLIEHPLPPARRRPQRALRRWGSLNGRSSRESRVRTSRSKKPGDAERGPLPVPTQLPQWDSPEGPEDLIMLELD
jgi:hypothetical protein